MEAPEKIYLQVCGDCNSNDCKSCKFEDLEENITWSKGKIFDKDIEYTRTDALIKKAEEFLWEHIDGTDYHVNYILKEFKKYIKGE